MTEQLQRESTTPRERGCAPNDFVKKAHAYILYVRPNLAQRCSDDEAGEFIIEMMSKSLAAD